MTFEIGVVHRTRPHLLADLSELLLLVKYDSLTELSQARLESIAKEVPAAAEEVDAQDRADAASKTAADAKDILDRSIEDCWSQLEYRQGVFKGFYPFVIDGDVLRWRRKKPSTSEQIYLFLLLCARLRSFSASFRQQAAKLFVDVSKEAFRALAGNAAEVRIFDANSDDRKSFYGTDLRKALRKLGIQLSAHGIHEAAIDQVSASGDGGLDLVAVQGFLDGASGCFAIFGQCGAQETNWPSKTFEAHPIRFASYFTLLNQPDNVYFIPISYRDASGKWVDSNKTAGCLLVDRLRIVRLLGKDSDSRHAKIVKRLKPVLDQAVAM